MQDIEKLSKEIEQAISHHDSNAMQKVVQEMQSWKTTQHESKDQISLHLQQLNNKLHHDGYLPRLNIVGFEYGENGKLIANPSDTHAKLTIDKNLNQLDPRHHERHYALDKPGHKEDLRNETLEQKRHKLEGRCGVTVEEKDGKYLYHLKANGQDTVVCKTEASLSGLQQGDVELKKQIKDKEAKLTHDHHVKFSETGEDAVPRDHNHKDLGYIKSRMPELDELEGIEAALKHSQPSQLLENKKGSDGVKFYFLSETSSESVAYYYRDKHDKPAVFIEPGAQLYPTEKGAKGDQVRNTVESVLTHELAHNAQHKLGWDDPSTKKSYAEQIGWTQSLSNPDEYYMQDKHGGLFKYEPKSHDFVHVNKYGQPLDSHQHIVSEKNALHLKPGDPEHHGNDTMFGRAKVTPATHYFVNPTEMFADGMQAFRLDEARRANLLKESPALYEACKRQDQMELNQTYGWGKMTRDPEGNVVPDTWQEQSRIRMFERKPPLDGPKAHVA